jgi:hypothetical protein
LARRSTISLPQRGHLGRAGEVADGAGWFDATPLVKGISASQISPALGIVVESLVLGHVTVQEGSVIAQGQRRARALLSGRRMATGHPSRQFLEILRREQKPTRLA